MKAWRRHAARLLGCGLVVLGLTALAAPAYATHLTYDELSFDIFGVGTVAGTDYEPFVSDDAIDLDGVALYALVDVGQFCNAIEILPNGNTYTLISTTGDLTGSFAGWPGPIQDGDTVRVIDSGRVCFQQPRGELEIHYHRDGPVKTVTGTVVNGSPIPVSQVQLGVWPDAPQTNQPTTLVATVAVSSGTPQGTVAFSAEAAAFPAGGCLQQPLVRVGNAYVATCTMQPTPMQLIPSPHAGPNVTATFTPDDPTLLRGAHAGQRIWVAAGATETRLGMQTDPGAGDGSPIVAATVVPALAGAHRPLDRSRSRPTGPPWRAALPSRSRRRARRVRAARSATSPPVRTCSPPRTSRPGRTRRFRSSARPRHR